MANFQIVALDPTTPQLRAPGTSDAYTLPRPIMGANIKYNMAIFTSGVTLTPFYNGYFVECSGSFTVSLDFAGVLGAGYTCIISNTGTGSIIIDPAGSELIDGVSTITLRRGDTVQIFCDGVGWEISRSGSRGYSDNLLATDTRPQASGDKAIAIGQSAVASSLWSIAMGFGSGATGSGAMALGYFSSASGSYSVALTGTASAASSTAIGRNSAGVSATTASGGGSVSLGGSYASGTDSFAAAIGTNSSSYGATGPNSVAMGLYASASSNYAVSIGWGNSAGNRSLCIGGNSSVASDNSICVGSWGSYIAAPYSATLGGGKAYDRGQQNRWAYGINGSPGLGHVQAGMFVLYKQTTDATPTALTSTNAAPYVNNIPVLSDYCAYAFTGTVIAKQSSVSTAAAAAWKIEGMIVRGGGAASTTLVASTVTVISNVPGWTLALSADTTNGGLLVTGTGAAATTIRWVANIQSSEVINS